MDDDLHKSATRVFIGGGAEAGAWAAQLVARGAAAGALIVSDAPPGAAPYNRHNGVTRGLLDPKNDKGRAFDGLPLCSYQVGPGGSNILSTRALVGGLWWYVTHASILAQRFSMATCAHAFSRVLPLGYLPLCPSPY